MITLLNRVEGLACTYGAHPDYFQERCQVESTYFGRSQLLHAHRNVLRSPQQGSLHMSSMTKYKVNARSVVELVDHIDYDLKLKVVS